MKVLTLAVLVILLLDPSPPIPKQKPLRICCELLDGSCVEIDKPADGMCCYNGMDIPCPKDGNCTPLSPPYEVNGEPVAGMCESGP